ncbi:MAG: hypothetical protein AB7T59_00460 [Hyphomonadaceae bacterium]
MARMIPQIMESNAVPNTEAGRAARAARLTPSDAALLTYAAFRGWVMQSKMRPAHRARFIEHIDMLIADGFIFPDIELDTLAFQEFWHASLGRAQRDDKSIWMAASECFLERLGAGGLQGEDAFRSMPLAVALAGNARLLDADLAKLTKRFRLA